MSEHELWNELGNLYFLSGAYEQAVHAYHHSIQLDQSYGRPYSNLALIYARRGQHQLAVELFRTSLDLLTENTEKAISWNRLGNLHRQARDYDRALIAFQCADDLDPVCKDGREDLGQMLFATTDLTILEQAHRIKESEPPIVDTQTAPEPEVIPTTGQALQAGTPLDQEEIHAVTEEGSDAEWLTPWLELQAEDDRDLVADTRFEDDEREDISEASEDEALTFVLPERFPLQYTVEQPVEESLLVTVNQPATGAEGARSDPNLEAARQDVAPDAAGHQQPVSSAEPSPETDGSFADPDGAQDAEAEFAKLRRMVQINPRNAQAWDSLGSLHKSVGQYREAIVAYQQAISIDSSRADYYHHLGLVHAIVGQNEDAIMALQKVLEYAPDHSLAHATLGGYFRKMGLEELAQKHIGKAMKNIYDSESEYNRACFEAIRGNVDQAIELLRIALENRQTYAEWVVHDPDLDFIRDDPRFRQLVSDYTR